LVAAAQRTGKAKTLSFRSSPRKRGPSSWALDSRLRGNERRMPSWLWRCPRTRPAGGGIRAQHLAPGAAGLQVKCVDDGKTKAAGRHGVVLGFLVLVKRDLHARNAGHLPHLCGERFRRVAIARAMRPEQHHAVSVAAVLIGEVPS